MGTIGKSSALFSQSWTLLRSQPSLTIFPVITSAAQVLVMASFAALLFTTGGLREFIQAAEEGEQAVFSHVQFWPILYAFYFVTIFVQVFFSTALIGAALEHFRGRPATVGAGLSLASSRLPQILGWTFVAATVGLILQMIAERVGVLGRIVMALIGMGWSVACYFVLPVLAAEGVGPFTALRRSVAALRKAWGEGLVLNVGLGLAGALLMFAAITPAMIGVGITTVTQNVVPAVIGVTISIIAGVALSVAISTLSAIIKAALYRFAVDGEVPTGFDRAELAAAFGHK